MKKLTLICCLLLIPLTLASDTQHRYKVHVLVDGDDAEVVRELEIHLRRELRLLGDVDIVGEDADWRYALTVFALALETTDGRKTGYYAIAHYTAIRLAEGFYRVPKHYEDHPAMFNISRTYAMLIEIAGFSICCRM